MIIVREMLGALRADYEKDQVRILSNPDATSVYLRAARASGFIAARFVV